MICRKAGLNLELSDVAVPSLKSQIPEPLQRMASAADFMQQLPHYVLPCPVNSGVQMLQMNAYAFLAMDLLACIIAV